jgi:hypothetical protein
MSGFSLSALFTSDYIEGLQWKKPLILLGFSRFCEMVSHNVYSMEIAPAQGRLALINVSAFPGMMLAGITGAVLWQAFGNFQLLNLATAVTVALSFGIVLTLPEPRGTPFPPA